MQQEQSYIYDIILSYEYQGKRVQFSSMDIHTLIIDEKFTENHMPVLMINFRCDKLIMNDMIDNVNNKTVILEIYKVLDNIQNSAQVKVREKYIVEEFNFIIARDKVYDDDLVYNINQLNQTIEQKKYTNVSLGLIPKNIIKRNRRYISGAYKNVRAIDVLYDNANGMNLLIEPFDNNKVYPLLMIPPMESYSQLIDYLQLNCGFYNENFPRYFYDFDKTYIINQNGNPVESTDELLNTVIINLERRTDNQGKSRGLIIDTDRRAYIVNIDPTFFDIKEDKSYIIASDKNVIINNMGDGDIQDSEHPTIIRNPGQMNYEKNTYVRHFVNVIKTEVDGSIFTLNKEYIIKNYSDINGEQAKFKLVHKSQIFTKYDKMYALRLILNFEKIYPDT